MTDRHETKITAEQLSHEVIDTEVLATTLIEQTLVARQIVGADIAAISNQPPVDRQAEEQSYEAHEHRGVGAASHIEDEQRHREMGAETHSERGQEDQGMDAGAHTESDSGVDPAKPLSEEPSGNYPVTEPPDSGSGSGPADQPETTADGIALDRPTIDIAAQITLDVDETVQLQTELTEQTVVETTISPRAADGPESGYDEIEDTELDAIGRMVVEAMLEIERPDEKAVTDALRTVERVSPGQLRTTLVETRVVETEQIEHRQILAEVLENELQSSTTIGTRTKARKDLVAGERETAEDADQTHELTINDSTVGKTVMSAGSAIGTVTAVEAEALVVDPQPTIATRIKSMLDWGETDDEYRVGRADILKVTDDTVEIQEPNGE